jgi:hypothetical protein
VAFRASTAAGVRLVATVLTGVRRPSRRVPRRTGDSLEPPMILVHQQSLSLRREFANVAGLFRAARQRYGDCESPLSEC